MKKTFWLPIAILMSAAVVTVAVAQNNSGKLAKSVTDTVPEKNRKIKDIDDAINEVERSKAEVEKSIKDIDWQKIQKEIQEAMNTVNKDMAKMRIELEKSFKEIDAAKIQADVQKALKEIDTEKFKKDLHEAIDKVDAEKIKKEVEAAVSKVDVEKIRKEVENIKIDLSGVELELKKLKPTLEKSLEEARVGIERAKKELTDYKNLINALEGDQLINKQESYTIEYRNHELTVNGKKVPADQLKKYESFLKDKKDFRIKKDGQGFNIDND